MKRYPPSEVLRALEATERGSCTPHDQMVLAAEVRALQAAMLAIAAHVDTACAYLESEAINAAVSLAPELQNG